jgi:hypothetical protein
MCWMTVLLCEQFFMMVSFFDSLPR